MYGPERFREISKERYLISKHTNTSYKDVGEITPTERIYLIQFITEDLKRQQTIIENQINKGSK